MSIAVMTQVWASSRHKGSALVMLLAIADSAKENGLAWPGYKYLAAKSRMSERNAVMTIRRLCESGELILETRGGGARSNLYRVNLAQLRRQADGDLATLEEDITPEIVAAVQDGEWGVKSGARGVQPASPETSKETSKRNVRTTSPAVAVATPAGDDVPLPGFEPPPPAQDPDAARLDAHQDRVTRVWEHYANVFPQTRKVGLTPPRTRTISKALRAVNDDETLCMRAIDGLKSYRQANPQGSRDVALSVIFATGPHSKSNLTDQIEWWAAQSNGRLPSSDSGATIPLDLMGVPSVTAGKIRTYRDNVKRMIDHPNDEGARRHGARARAWLRENCGHVPVIEDGRLRGWRLAEPPTEEGAP